MGVPFTAIAGVNAISFWPELGTFALIKKYYAILTHRRNAVPRGRTTSIYINQSASGSSLGGGGTGSFLNPYLVRHMADLKVLFTTVLVSNCAVYLRNGDIFMADKVNSDQKIYITLPNVSVAGYSDPNAPSDVPPVVGGFALLTGGTDLGGNVIEFATGSVRAYWIMGKLAGTSYEGYFAQPYKRMATVGAVTGVAYSFCDDGTKVRINCGAHDPALLMAAVTTSAGILIANVDNVGIFDVVADCWGTNVPGTAGGGQCIRSEAEGTNEHLIIGCKTRIGPYHVAGHVNSTGSGGISTWIDCEFGLFQWDSSGGGDGHIAFGATGDLECIRYRCKLTHAGLRDSTLPDTRGVCWRCHTNSAAQPVALLIELCNDGKPSWGDVAGLYWCPTVPALADNRATSSYRVFVHKCRYHTGSNSTSDNCGLAPDSMIAAVTNTRISQSFAPPSGLFGTPTGSNPSAYFRAAFTNVEWDIELTSSWTGKTLVPMWNTSANNHDFDFVHSRIRIRGSTPNAIIWQPGGAGKNSSFWNSVISNETGVAAGNVSLTGATEYFREADPAVAAGGFASCSFFGHQLAQYDGTPSYQTLGAAPSYTVASQIPAAMINASQALPAGLNCEFDFDDRMRSTNPTKRTRGPIEARPIFPEGGGTSIGVVISPTLLGG